MGTFLFIPKRTFCKINRNVPIIAKRNSNRPLFFCYLFSELIAGLQLEKIALRGISNGNVAQIG